MKKYAGVWIAVVLLLVVCTSLFGCASSGPSFYVNVDSLALPGVSTKSTYILVPGNKNVSSEDLEFKEFANYVHRALATHGFQSVEMGAEADVVILLSYGIGNPKEYTRILGWRRYTFAKTYTEYFRYMILAAYDFDVYRKEQREIQLWKITVTSSGSSDDLRRVMPVLVAAAQPYIGTNTGKKVEVVLDENDATVQKIMGDTK